MFTIFKYNLLKKKKRIPRWLTDKESHAHTGDAKEKQEFNPWVRKIPWRRKCNSLHYSCLENPMDREAWQAIVHGVTENQTQLSDSTLACMLKT